MTDFAEVNPANVADIYPGDANGKGYSSADGVGPFVTNVGGESLSRLFDANIGAPHHLYIEDDQTATTPVPGGRPLSYYTRTPVRTFTGSLGDPAARVVLTYSYAQIPIADLYEQKRSEISAHDRIVRYNAVDTSLSENWWLIATETARTELNVIGIGVNRRAELGQPWPSGVNAPWVGIYNDATGDARRYQLKVPDGPAHWDILLEEWYQHDQATGNATDASRTALDAAYADGAGSWEAVADHDAADPAWLYPETVDPLGLNAATV